MITRRTGERKRQKALHNMLFALATLPLAVTFYIAVVLDGLFLRFVNREER